MISLLQQYGYKGFLAAGALSIIALTLWRRQKYGLSMLSAVCFSMLLIITGTLGAKLLSFAKSGFTSFNGMAFYGSIFLNLLLVPLFGLPFRMKPAQSWDLSAPAAALLISCFRFGCYCAGCCGGVLCTIGSFTFRWPAQMLESFGDMVLTVILLRLEGKEICRGLLHPIFLVSYGSMRFVIEWMRDMPELILGLSEGHWNSLLSILIGVVWLFVHRKITRKRQKVSPDQKA